MKTLVFVLAVLFSLSLSAHAASLPVVLDKLEGVSGDPYCGSGGGLYGSAAVAAGSSVFFMGGVSAATGSYSNKVCKFAPASKTFSVVTSRSFSAIPARAYAATCYTSTAGMVVAGGFDGSEATPAAYYNPAADGATWYSAFTLSASTYAGAMVCSGAQAVHLGGRLTSGAASKAVYVSQLETSAGWSSVDTYSASWGGRWGHAAILFNSTVFVVGGRNSSTILGEVWYTSWADLVASGGVWMQASALMTPVYGIANQVFASNYTKGIYVVGGRSSTTSTTKTIQFLDMMQGSSSSDQWSAVSTYHDMPLALQDGAAVLVSLSSKAVLYVTGGVMVDAGTTSYSNSTLRGSLLHCTPDYQLFGNWTYSGDSAILRLADGSFDASSVVRGSLKCLRYSNIIGETNLQTCNTATGMWDVTPSCGEVAWSRADPHFVGFKGQKFDVNGLPDRVFNWYSDVDIQINAHIIQTVERTKATYVNAVGVRLGAQEPMKGIDFRVWPERRMKIWPFHKINHPLYGQIGRIDDCGYAKWTSRDVLEVHWQQYHLLFSRRRWHIPGQSFIYMDIQVRTSRFSPLVHGLLGQTHWSTGTAAPDAKQGEGVIQGSIEDYVVEDGLFGLNSTHIVYKGAQGIYNATNCPLPVSNEDVGAVARTTNADN